VEDVWTRLEIQLNFLCKVSHHLNEQLAQSQYFLLQKLHGKLVQATSQLDISGPKFWQKLKHAFVKERLDELIQELETWQKRFDPTWYLIILISNSSIDSELCNAMPENEASPDTGPLHNFTALRHVVKQASQTTNASANINSSINLDESGLVDAIITAIPYSSARIVVRKGSSKMLIAESVESYDCELSQVKRLVENLARRLKHVDTEVFCLLQCYGILKHRDSLKRNTIRGIDMIYRAPEGCKPPVSLRQLLLKQKDVSLSARIRIAKQLAQSVLYVHTCDFVHKGIRLVFPDRDGAIGPSFLIGFNQFRETHFQTNLKGDACWHRNLYRHPQRQGISVVDRYVMQHDIYSLGVCLLEIGLWGPFVWYPTNGANPIPGFPLDMSLTDANFEDVRYTSQGQTKVHLVNLATRKLPSLIGDLYTKIVVACLRCLDPENGDFGTEQELKDEDGLLVGVRFVEKVVLKLEDISV
jgi:hypothetical protein